MESKNSLLTKDDISASFEEWKKEQRAVTLRKRISLKKKRYRSRARASKSNKARGQKEEQLSNVQALSEEFLNEVASSELSKEKEVNSADSKLLTGVDGKKKKKRKLKLTSSLIDTADYIPLDTNLSSTNFKVVRLDKDRSDSMAATAMNFYNKRRFGKYVHRVPTKSLFLDCEKIEAKNNLRVKLK